MKIIAFATVLLVCCHDTLSKGDESKDDDVQGTDVPQEVLSKCDRYLAELFRQPDESALVDELCERINNSVATNELSTLEKMPLPQKLLWDVWSAKALIDNGGMEYYLTGDFVDYAGRANSFRKLGLAGCADAIERAYAVFPQGRIPDDVDERQKAIDELPEETRDRWDLITSEYFDHDGQLTLLLGEYARKNAEDFIDLRGRYKSADYAALLQKNSPIPALDASPEQIIAWLEAIGGGSHDQSAERLTRVWLGDNRRSTSRELASLAAMDAARDIEEIGLESTCFKDSDAPLLLKFPQLRILHISETNVSGQTADIIEQIPTLRVVWMRETKISYDRFRELVQRKEFDEFFYGRGD